MSPGKNNIDHSALVKKAQLGCQQSVDRLVEAAQKSILAYTYRLTLDRDLAEDLCQESMLEMVRSLKQIREPDRFWGWLYRMALGKVQHHYRQQQRRKAAEPGFVEQKERLLQDISAKYDDGLMTLVNKELSQAVVEAIAKLKLKYRNILVLRCYQQLEYNEIAELMGIKEMTARVLFHRAKLSLKKGLSKRGFGSAMLLTALGLFGTMTAPADAGQVVVGDSAVKVGICARILGAITSRIGVAFTTTVVTTVVTIGTVSYKASGSFDIPDRADVRSFHHIEQSWSRANSPNPNLMRGRSLSKGAFEQWHYFPEGLGGPMFLAMQRWNPQQTAKLCGWCQDASGNYYYYSGTKTIFLYDYNLPKSSMKTRRLPSDTLEFTEFLDEIEGKDLGIDYTRDSRTGLLTGVLDTRFYNAKDFKDTLSYNIFGEEKFGQFRHSWPENTPVVDERDTMHQREWTYFSVKGRINGKDVAGTGRIPFIYNAAAENWAWLKLDVGNDLKIVDSYFGAFAADNDGKVLVSYPPGSLFKGLARPWFGMHAIDIVRRDAVENRIGFSIENYDGDDEHYGRAKIRMFSQSDPQDELIVYTINIDKDLLEEIEFAGQSSGERNYLKFTHYQDIDQLSDEFKAPEKIRLPRRTRRSSIGMLWLTELSQGTFGK